MSDDWDEWEHPRHPDGRFRLKNSWADEVSIRLPGRGLYRAGRDIRDELDYDQLEPKMPFAGWRFGGGDAALSDILAHQGFDGLPEVVDSATLDQRVRDGWLELWRGVSSDETSGGFMEARDMVEQFRSGPLFIGSGVNGNGTYTATNRDRVLGYSEGSSLFNREGTGEGLIRMALRPDARVIAFTDAATMLRPGNRGARSLILSDVGRAAAAAGYDAIAVRRSGPTGPNDGPNQYVILNRTALAVEEARSDG